MPKNDYYKILSVDRNSSQEAIKRAYRGLAMKHHPDRNQGDPGAADRMKEINEAYAILSDSTKRQLYDQHGHAGLQGYSSEDIFGDIDFSSIFQEFGLGNLFGFGSSGFGGSVLDALFGTSRSSRQGPRREPDLRYDLTVTLEEAALGTTKRFELPLVRTCSICQGSGATPQGLHGCSDCSGTGQVVTERKAGPAVFRQITSCKACRGSGRVISEFCNGCTGKGTMSETRTFTVELPPGIDTGQAIKIEGGSAGESNFSPDLYVVIHVKPHSIFKRQGDDLYVQYSIDAVTAALGDKIAIPCLEGTIHLEIPKGTQTADVVKSPKMGIPHLNGRGRGDLFVLVTVKTPTNLSSEEEDLMRALQRLRKKNNS